MTQGKTTSPAIVLVTGAWMSPFHCKPAKPVFEGKGYTFRAVGLASVGVRNVRATWEDDVDRIYGALLEEEAASGKDICLILHSYAGATGPEAVEKFNSREATNGISRSRVVNMILIAIGFDDFQQEMLSNPVYHHIAHVEDGYNVITNPANGLFTDLSPEEAKPYVDALQPQEQFTGSQVRNSDELKVWDDVDTTYFVCLRDQTVQPSWQKSAPAKRGIKTLELDTDHCPMTTNPTRLVEAVDKVLGVK